MNGSADWQHQIPAREESRTWDAVPASEIRRAIADPRSRPARGPRPHGIVPSAALATRAQIATDTLASVPSR